MGSSRYATGAPSRRITPWRLGFGRAASAFEALADADSVRSGLKRLRLAMVPNAPPDRSVAAGAVAVDATGDRKSTRLNSSHGYISYAVFCLKKKKKRIGEKSTEETWLAPTLCRTTTTTAPPASLGDVA